MNDFPAEHRKAVRVVLDRLGKRGGRPATSYRQRQRITGCVMMALCYREELMLAHERLQVLLAMGMSRADAEAAVRSVLTGLALGLSSDEADHVLALMHGAFAEAAMELAAACGSRLLRSRYGIGLKPSTLARHMRTMHAQGYRGEPYPRVRRALKEHANPTG